MATDIYYQMFETYYKKAQEAETNHRFAEARKMYLLAAETLLKAAKTTNGQIREALIQRADKLQRLAYMIVVENKEVLKQQQQSENQISYTEKQQELDGKIWETAGKPNIRFSDIAGLTEVKDSIRRRIILPRQHPELYETFRRELRGGILLYGPPGTGKTMIAKAIAAEIDAAFYSIRCSDIVGKYFGEAEKNIKSLFDTARQESSAIIFFDEFEALAAQRGGDSSVMNRLVPELLSQMDGFQTDKSGQLMILAATNRPWDIDSAILRPPRFSEKIYVALPDREARFFLINRQLDDVPVAQDVNIMELVRFTEGYNAADIVALCGIAKDIAIERSIKEGYISLLTMNDFEQAIKSVSSSVQKNDLLLLDKWKVSTCANNF